MINYQTMQREEYILKLLVTATAYLILFLIILNNNIQTYAKEIAINLTNINTTTNGSVDTAELFFDKSAEKEKWRADVQRRYPRSTILTIKEGVKHIRMMQYINGRPIRINVIEINPKINDKLFVKPVMAANTLNNRTPIKALAQKENAIAAINGSYFKPQTGVPLGTMMVDGNFLTGPVYNRVALGIKGNKFIMGRIGLDAKLTTKHKELKIDNINQPRMLSTYILIYNKKWGKNSPPAPKYGALIAVSEGKVIQTGNGSPLAIPENGFVISGPKAKLEPFFNEKNIKLNIKTDDALWDNVEHIISGGPYLVKENEIYIDVTAEKLHSVTGRNPRTAIGYTQDGKFIMVTIDGREESSVGMTLSELAYFMKKIGCYNAMNLDGGGSSVMYFNGMTVNKPSIRGGIPLSNALVLYESEMPIQYAQSEGIQVK